MRDGRFYEGFNEQPRRLGDRHDVNGSVLLF